MSSETFFENELRTRITVEGEIFELTKGTDDLAEVPGRIGLFVCSSTGSSVKMYFDDLESLNALSLWFDEARSMMEIMRKQV